MGNGTDQGCRVFDGLSGTHHLVYSTGFTQDQWYLINVNSSGSDMNLYIDGTEEATNAFSFPSISRTVDIARLYTNTTSGTHEHFGQIAEIIVLDSESSSQERQDIESYINTKWGV